MADPVRRERYDSRAGSEPASRTREGDPLSGPPLFLGVDSGGTKTGLCIVDGAGHSLAFTRAPSMYYFNDGLELVERVLSQAVAEVCHQAHVQPDQITYAFISFAGYGEASEDLRALDALPATVLGHHRYACGNDMICGWAGSLGAADGINVVSGTGSMAYGERAGTGARAGGWGEVFGDEGSGYWIAIRGLEVFSQMSDGRLLEGPLLQLIRARLGLTHDLDAVSTVIHRWQRSRSRIASLGPVVGAAAEAGDECAAAILGQAGRELARLVDAVAGNLSFTDEEVIPVSYSGGTFESVAVLQSFRDAVAALGRTFEVRPPLLDPIAGAAVYAAKRSGHPLSPAAISRLGAETA